MQYEKERCYIMNKVIIKKEEVNILNKLKIIATILVVIAILSVNMYYVNAESEIIKIDTYNLILNKIDEDTLEPISTHASYEISIGVGQKITASTDNNGQIKITGIKLPEVAGKYTYTIEEKEAPNQYDKEETIGMLEITFENRPGGSSIIMDDKGQLYQTSALVVTNAEIISGEHIWVPSKADGGWTEDTVNVYATNKRAELYLKSDVYEIGYHTYPDESEDGKDHIDYDSEYQKGDTYIRKIVHYNEEGKAVASIKGNIEITVEEFKSHLETNAQEIKVLDKDGNEILDEKTYLRTGMDLYLKKGKEEISLKLIVYGDTGDFVDRRGRPRWTFINSALQKTYIEPGYYKTLSNFKKEVCDLTLSGKFGRSRRETMLSLSISQAGMSKPGVELSRITTIWN